jgi:3D (Asp-Asp-Asp) domain-containing protein
MSYRHWIAALWVLAVILVLVFFFARPAGAQVGLARSDRGLNRAAQSQATEGSSSAVVHGTDGGMNIRTGPNVSFQIVGVVPEGTRVTVLTGPRSDGDRDWYEVRGTDTRGRQLRGWGVETYLLPTQVRAAAGADETAQEAAGRSFLATVRGYTSGGAIGQVTATGTRVRWGTAAVDPEFIPLGSLLLVEGFNGVFSAEDVGGTIQGAQLDLWFPNRESALDWGVQRRRVTILREGP